MTPSLRAIFAFGVMLLSIQPEYSSPTTSIDSLNVSKVFLLITDLPDAVMR